LPDDYDDLEEEVHVPEGVRHAMLAVEVQRILTPTCAHPADGDAGDAGFGGFDFSSMVLKADHLNR
jgi:hypothetical protein